MRINIRAFSFILVLFGMLNTAFSSELLNKSQTDTNKIKQDLRKRLGYSQFYPFIKYYQNYMEWGDSSAIYPFFRKLMNVDKQKITILHIGDSHIQADVFTGYVRGQLQELFGDGGRGFIFPYAGAQTHSAYNYRNYVYGEWDFSRNVQPFPVFDLGLTGATIHTKDPNAAFRFAFTPGVLGKNNKLVKLYYKKSPNSYSIKFWSSSMKDSVLICNDTIKDELYSSILMPHVADTLSFSITQTDSNQYFFECYGVQLENPDNYGVYYNSVGINGAGYKSILRERLLEEQLKSLNPDLVVIDLGSNDFYPYNINTYEISNDLKAIINKVKGNAPNASILISNTHDLYKRQRNISGAKTFSEITRKIAMENNCALYDFYNVSGGQYSMLQWLSKNLARRDRIHLSSPGYLFKGELFTNAFINSYLHFLQQPLAKSFIVDSLVTDSTLTRIKHKDSVIAYSKDTIMALYKKIETKSPYEYKGTGSEVYYKIEYGDNLGSIAEQFGVSVSDIQMWNNMHGSRIIAGETLIIYSGKTNKQNTEIKPSNNTIVSKSGNKIVYEIQSGDNLSGIALRFKVTANDIMTWNNMSNSNIFAGDNLIIYQNGEGSNAITNSDNTKGTKQYYTVKAGDNLGSIAQKYGVSLTQLKSWNSLSGNNIRVGQKLMVYSVKKPVETTSTTVERNKISGRGIRHTVVSGDTLWGIAQKYNTSVQSIKEANALKDDRLDVGMVLIIQK